MKVRSLVLYSIARAESEATSPATKLPPCVRPPRQSARSRATGAYIELDSRRMREFDKRIQITRCEQLGPNRETTRPRGWVTAAAILLALTVFASFPAPTYAKQSDFNKDGVVDLEDVKILSDTLLKQDWQTVDWCAWAELEDHLQDKHYQLVEFVREYFECDAPPPPPGEDPLAVKNENIRPTRLAWGPNGKLYVSDAKSRSVFLYDVTTDATGQAALNLTGELKNLGYIVGVAVDSAGDVYVGNSQHDRVEKYNLNGELLAIIGDGTIRMPTDLTFDASGNLYVADPDADVVWVYRPDGTLLRTIRRGGLKRPMAVEVAYVDDGAGNMVGELYVASSKDYLVKVFDLQGNQLRSFGGFVEKQGWFNPTYLWHGKFVSLQSLAVDPDGRVHALDAYMNNAQILDATTGDYISFYGGKGTEPGQMMLPLDLTVSSTGVVVVANADNRRVEIMYQVP